MHFLHVSVHESLCHICGREAVLIRIGTQADVFTVKVEANVVHLLLVSSSGRMKALLKRRYIGGEVAGAFETQEAPEPLDLGAQTDKARGTRLIVLMQVLIYKVQEFYANSTRRFRLGVVDHTGGTSDLVFAGVLIGRQRGLSSLADVFSDLKSISVITTVEGQSCTASSSSSMRAASSALAQVFAVSNIRAIRTHRSVTLASSVLVSRQKGSCEELIGTCTYILRRSLRGKM